MHRIALERKYFLIETLAIQIANELLHEFSNIEKVSVRVRKNNPPIGGVIDCVEVEVIKENNINK